MTKKKPRKTIVIELNLQFGSLHFADKIEFDSIDKASNYANDLRWTLKKLRDLYAYKKG